MDPFPFPSLPADIRRELLKYSGTYGPISGLSRETLALTRNPSVLRGICDRPISAKEIADLAEWFINAYGSLILARSLSEKKESESPLTFVVIIVIKPWKKYGIEYNKPMYGLFGGLEAEIYRMDPVSSRDDPSLRNTITNIFNQGYTQVPLRFRYLVNNKRATCVENILNFSVVATRRSFSRDLDELRSMKDLISPPERSYYIRVFLNNTLNIPNLINNYPDDRLIDWIDRNLQTLLSDPYYRTFYHQE